MESIHRYLLSSVRRRKYDVVNFIIQAPVFHSINLVGAESTAIDFGQIDC